MGQVMDKRAARKEHKEQFVKAVDEIRQQLLEATETVPVNDEHQANSDIVVAIRKRPIFDKEVASGEFDVLTCIGQSIAVHDCRMHPDMKQMFVSNSLYPFDYVFDEKTESQTVFDSVIDPLVSYFLGGKSSCVLMYGQTGSGKTYTMTAIQELLCSRLFKDCTKTDDEEVPSSQWCVVGYEIAGKGVCDLQQPGQPELQVREDGSNRVQVCGAKVVQVDSAEALLAALEKISSSRHTQATQQNDRSSRTHCVVRIYAGVSGVDNSGSTSTTKRQVSALEHRRASSTVKEFIPTLTLVDLAGSERNADSATHDAERRKECAQINSSLMNLKECVRQRALMRKGVDNARIPYRQAKLTMVLKDTFGSDCKTSVISCVCPASTSTEHSINTIEHSCLMKINGTGNTAAAPPSQGPSPCSSTTDLASVTASGGDTTGDCNASDSESEGRCSSANPRGGRSALEVPSSSAATPGGSTTASAKKSSSRAQSRESTKNGGNSGPLDLMHAGSRCLDSIYGMSMDETAIRRWKVVVEKENLPPLEKDMNTWSHEEVMEWLKNVESKKWGKKGISVIDKFTKPPLDGKSIVRLPEKRLQQLTGNEKVGALLYTVIRDEIAKLNQKKQERREQIRQMNQK
eukprot:GHVL01009289.1.p1 GENE.GHVL01009289.1~~GHVL01009289.1.p1  ORF type:complete len:631 (-),score=95.34 GHVL01009289.1:2901-4793(-)